MSLEKKVTLDDAWRVITELGEAQKETDRQLKETSLELREAQKETDRQLKETSLELREAQKETDRQLKETDRQLKETDRRFNSQWGKLIESLVEGDLVRRFSEWGIPVKDTSQRVKKTFLGKQYEFDIVAHDGKKVVVVEVKTTLKVKDVDHFIEKLKKFKEVFPRYSENTIYGAVAYITSDQHSNAYSQNKHLFVIKATGNSSSIVNKKDFVPREF